MSFLLERLSVTPVGTDRKAEAFDEEAAILAQIQRILATWRQTNQFVSKVPWGMQSVVEIGYNATVQLESYAQALGQAIGRYEPRLRSVSVKVEAYDNALTPHQLVVTAIFPGEDQPRNVRVAAPY